MNSNPGWVELLVHTTSVQVALETKYTGNCHTCNKKGKHINCHGHLHVSHHLVTGDKAAFTISCQVDFINVHLHMYIHHKKKEIFISRKLSDNTCPKRIIQSLQTCYLGNWMIEVVQKKEIPPKWVIRFTVHYRDTLCVKSVMQVYSVTLHIELVITFALPCFNTWSFTHISHWFTFAGPQLVSITARITAVSPWTPVRPFTGYWGNKHTTDE